MLKRRQSFLSIEALNLHKTCYILIAIRIANQPWMVFIRCHNCMLIRFGVNWDVVVYAYYMAYFCLFYVMWHDMTWYDMTWCNMMWCDMSWCDMPWCDVTWCDMTWHDMNLQVKTPRSQLQYTLWYSLVLEIINFDL